jgi:heptosyltransferase-2
VQLRELGAKTIVIRLPNWVGDAVMATPVLRALRAAAPEARIVALGTPAVLRLLQGLPWVDQWFAYERGGRHRGFLGFWRAARELRHTAAAGLTLLLPHSFSSALMARLSGGGRIAGYHSLERGWLLHDAPRAPREGRKRRPTPMTRHYLQLLASLGSTDRNERMELRILEAESQAAEAALRELGLAPRESYFAVNPGASFGSSKFWTVEGFAGTIVGLHERYGLRSLVLCGPGEELLARDIAGEAGKAALDTSPRFLPLQSLKPVLSRARLLVTTDTGPRHIAASFSVPTVVLMGATDPRYTETNLEWTTVLRAGVECSPCHYKVCPIDHRCMTQLTAEHALQAADALLQRADSIAESAHA